MLTEQQLAKILQDYHDRIAAEYRRRDAINRGEIPSPEPVTNWCITDRH